MSARTATKSQITAIQVAGAYIGTVVGAGFASGQETLRFFGMYGINGMWGLALSAVLFAFYGAVVLQLGRYLKAQSHLEIVHAVAGPYLGCIIDVFITVSLLAALTVMAAGAGAAGVEQFDLPQIVGSFAMVSITVITVLLGISGVVQAISLIAPFLMGGTILLSLMVMRVYVVNYAWTAPASSTTWWPLSAVAYVAYNLVLALGVLAPMGAMSDPATLRRGAILGGVGLAVCASALNLAILTQVPQAALQEIPMLYIVSKVVAHAPFVYAVLLLAEIYTTAVANLYALAARIAPPNTSKFTLVSIAAAVIALAGSQVGFAELVKVLYSGMGFMGVLVLASLTWWWWRNRGIITARGR